MYNVTYWEMNGRNKRRIDYACFARIRDKDTLPERVLYQCPIDYDLTQNQINFYLKFLRDILGNHFSWHRAGNNIFFRFILKGKKFTPVRALMYLTSFRYLDEFPSIPIAFFNFKEIKDLDELFTKFQELHVQVQQGTLKTKHGNMSGHGLIFNYGWASKTAVINLISLKQFIKNLDNSGIRRVHDYFLFNQEPVKPKDLVQEYKKAEVNFNVNQLKKVELFA